MRLGFGMCVLRPVKDAEVWLVGPLGYDSIVVVFGHSFLNTIRLLPGWKRTWSLLRSPLLMFGNSSRGSFRPGFPTKSNAREGAECKRFLFMFY